MDSKNNIATLTGVTAHTSVDASGGMKREWETPALKRVWEAPALTSIPLEDAQTGINFGPETLILLS